MRLFNLSPHATDIELADGSTLTLAASRYAARALTTWQADGRLYLDDRRDTYCNRVMASHAVSGMPQPRAGVALLVSLPVAHAILLGTERSVDDLYVSGGHKVRTGTGEIVCTPAVMSVSRISAEFTSALMRRSS